MQIKPRAYPHPVLTYSGDDIVGSRFQSTAAVKTEMWRCRDLDATEAPIASWLA
jgi:hypothetical protein